MKLALTIAGSDSGGGAGIQADLKTFSAHGVFGMSVITSVTAQNTKAVIGVEDISPEMVYLQIKAVFEDLPPDAVKIGMVSSASIIRSVAKGLDEFGPEKVVLDPVMISKSGHALLKPDAVEALKRELLPRCLVVTPNIPEAKALTGMSIKGVEDMERAAEKIMSYGCRAVVVKGGHLEGDAVDVFFDGREFHRLKSERIFSRNTHGTGCTFSSAIAANLALGRDLFTAVKLAKEYITGAIKNSMDIGGGAGPVHHFYELYRRAGLNV
ncbi:bifunctional hydroxymethylpyrimidine kinase/phosphomethylpyrimidine kinase [Thermosediminibacter oceani]|uniref:Hydroxymethylpyrimidine/phosphomethylpyrimidine kinase n=1 Tax=Thermosediminibacter oceani (strain ATCC BAA-1034 / DSM 16646 / JW/IW-1228P) TaxID=555079 RepID=D9RZC0_THEOJ|nr:bifunctional hydroxymethylpyrimidine kinase/phosphomethylpyrimidine kinase [Thermosediminibacter oceani]ADL06818.1 phosphomethylpyrimidine kinase [Thermosediminibacter oceani DSM 16646]